MNGRLTEYGRAKGSYRILVHDSVSGRLIREYGPIHNLIVLSLGRGYDIVARQLGGDTTYQIEIDSAKIGTSNTAPAASDTDLLAAVLSDIDVTSVEFVSPGIVRFSFFIPDAALASGTYREFGLFCNGRLFARSLLSPELPKSSSQNITVEYTIDFT